MRTLAHLSDLHFGRIDAAALGPLRSRLAALAPDLVVVSGDLTQRARAEQFRQARAYLDTLPKPQFVVPGNHDVPLYNVFRRFFRPLRNFQRIISEDPEPAFVDEEIAVLGVNTARSFVFKGGRVSEAQVAKIRQKFCRLGAKVTKVLVTHHPLERLADCGADVVLAGHLHATHVSNAGDGHSLSALVVHAGTATSRRTRAEPNAFNLLRLAPSHIEVDHYLVRGGDFVRKSTEAFDQRGAGWLRVGEQSGSA